MMTLPGAATAISSNDGPTQTQLASTADPTKPQHSTPVGLNALDDRRIREIKPLVPPQILMEDLPLSQTAQQTIQHARYSAEQIIQNSDDDDRLLVIVGPCSIHDTQAAVEYARRLREYAAQSARDLVIIMRVYFEKPRTTVGWKGLINDPFMDGSFKINKGLRIARELLLEINELGVPTGCEFLDTISPQYIGDLVSWGAIGARTTESQVHRELASGLSVPVGFKNGTDGSVQIAIDALKAVSEPHHFLSVTKQGLSAIVCTSGNRSCHIILRGGAAGPNYDAESVRVVYDKLLRAGVNSRVMIDCSHGNSQKDHRKQRLVVESIVEQITSNSMGNADSICGVMIESNLVEGRQDINPANPSAMKYGQSVTDACLGWEETVAVLDRLCEAVQQRRRNKDNR